MQRREIERFDVDVNIQMRLPRVHDAVHQILDLLVVGTDQRDAGHTFEIDRRQRFVHGGARRIGVVGFAEAAARQFAVQLPVDVGGGRDDVVSRLKSVGNEALAVVSGAGFIRHAGHQRAADGRQLQRGLFHIKEEAPCGIGDSGVFVIGPLEFFNIFGFDHGGFHRFAVEKLEVIGVRVTDAEVQDAGTDLVVTRVIFIAYGSHVVVVRPASRGNNKGAVADDVIVVQSVMSVGGEEEFLVAGHIDGVRGLQDKLRVGIFHRHFEGVIVDDGHAERFPLHFAAVDGAGVFDAEKRGTGGGFGGGVERTLPRVDKILRRDGGMRFIRPHRVFAQVKGKLGGLGVARPFLRYAGNDAAILVKTGESLKNIADDQQRIVIRRHLRVKVLRLVGERIADRLVGAVVAAARSGQRQQQGKAERQGDHSAQSFHQYVSFLFVIRNSIRIRQ